MKVNVIKINKNNLFVYYYCDAYVDINGKQTLITAFGSDESDMVTKFLENMNDAKNTKKETYELDINIGED